MIYFIDLISWSLQRSLTAIHAAGMQYALSFVWVLACLTLALRCFTLQNYVGTYLVGRTSCWFSIRDDLQQPRRFLRKINFVRESVFERTQLYATKVCVHFRGFVSI